MGRSTVVLRNLVVRRARTALIVNTAPCGVMDSGSNTDSGSNHLSPPELDIPSLRSYFFPIHRLSDHGAMGM
ncbi:hypothetical protein U9M48_001028 [Paspalum notatum var. saurae]|uniref:Uncharacterized protein n=1 Tax=Paspalum notatum var. saurae TaxID=547442 RepID=A0AAQ3PFF5_PASNO